MNPPGENSDNSGPFAGGDVDSLLASVVEQEQAAAALAVASAVSETDPVQACDFRNPSLLAPAVLRKLRLHQEEFADSMASQLSSHLRLEFTAKLTAVRTIACQKLAESWADPAHLMLFKLEPLRGVSVLEISHDLGAIMVDRLMGGQGKAPEAGHELSEIEKALLEQTVQLVLEEWCSHWKRLKELKPVILGYESNGRYVQAAPPETVMLVLVIEATAGEHHGRMQFGFPFLALEPFIRQMAQNVTDSIPVVPPTPASIAAPKWNAAFDEVSVPLTAEWEGPEMTARDVLALKPGDIITLDAKSVERVSVRLAGVQKFHGRPGSVAGNRAVELTQIIKPS